MRYFAKYSGDVYGVNPKEERMDSSVVKQVKAWMKKIEESYAEQSCQSEEEGE